MTKPAPTPDLEMADCEAICSTTTIAALLLLGAHFPHRQFNSAELSVLSGIGRTAMSQIKNATDDLLVGGPHAYATGEVRSKVQRAITRKTVAAQRKGGQRKILLDHLIERAKGRRVPKEELEAVKVQIARTLRESFTKRP